MTTAFTVVLVAFFVVVTPLVSSAPADGINSSNSGSDDELGYSYITKVREGTDPDDLYDNYFYLVEPLFSLPKERLLQLSSVKPGLPDLTLWYRVFVRKYWRSNVDTDEESQKEAIKHQLEALDFVDYVSFSRLEPLPAIIAPGSTETTPDFVPQQDYLRPYIDEYNTGIDAEYSWTFPGGNGEGITIYDVEYAFNPTHEDLVGKSIRTVIDPNETPANPFFPDNNHGTAVFGTMIGVDNGLGVKGISYGAAGAFAPEWTERADSNRANAILLAANDAKAGDVILLEMQTVVCGNIYPDDGSQEGYGPAENALEVFEVTQVATANGITVVATAGNGSQNLDADECNEQYDRDIRDSGAILVGAGGAYGDTSRRRLWYSCYGSRLDVHAWGEYTWTAGYGDASVNETAPDDKNKWYTNSFGGTSGAGSMVAGVVANIQGIAMKALGYPLDPLEVRQLLRDTGIPQVGEGNIGPLVNLRAAIDSLFDIYTESPSVTPTRRPTSKRLTPRPTTRRPTPRPSTQKPTPRTSSRKPTRSPRTL